MDDQPTYAEIPGFDGYRAGDDGSIWSCWIERRKAKGPWRKLVKQVTKKGYEQVGIGGRAAAGRKKLVHFLILLAFRGPRPDGMECLHANDIRSDNRLENLSWGTHRENVRQCVSRGRRRPPKRRIISVLDVLHIRWQSLHGDRQVDISRRLGISQQLVSAVCTGRLSGDVSWFTHGEEWYKWQMELQAQAVARSRQEATPCPPSSASSADPGTTASKTST